MKHELAIDVSTDKYGVVWVKSLSIGRHIEVNNDGVIFNRGKAVAELVWMLEPAANSNL